MKREWNKPDISNLSLEDTMARGGIMSTYDPDGKRLFAWMCCCGATSDFIYATGEDAEAALDQHEATCQDPCVIS